MRILGIDPGLGIVGFGVIDISSDGEMIPVEWGIIATSKDKSDSARLQEIHQDLTDLISRLKPDMASVEKIFFFKNAKTLVPVSQARGVILLVLEIFGIPLHEYTPMQVKQTISGYGKSEKKEIQQMVKDLLQLEKIPRPDDAADALALAVCYYNNEGRFAHPPLLI